MKVYVLAMWGVFIKEMDMVPQLMTIHPRTTLLGAANVGLSPDIDITIESRLAIQSWLIDNPKTKEGGTVQCLVP